MDSNATKRIASNPTGPNNRQVVRVMLGSCLGLAWVLRKHPKPESFAASLVFRNAFAHQQRFTSTDTQPAIANLRKGIAADLAASSLALAAALR